jgi:hypothetical protein
MRFVIKPSNTHEHDQPVVALMLDIQGGVARLIAENETHCMCVLEISPSGAVSLANNEALHWVGLRRGL